MRGERTLLRAGALGSALAVVQFTMLTVANAASAAPTPSATPSATPSTNGNCSDLIGLGKSLCEQQHGGAGTSVPAPSNPLDPLQSLAQGCATAAAWLVRKLSGAIDSTTQIDFTNTQFLRQYAVVFAASTFLTLILWLLAVAKRAVRGVPLASAFGEAIGFLWLTVMASAFTPLILYTVVSATDGLTQAIAVGTRSDTTTYLGTFADTLQKGNLGGGPIILIVVSLVAVLAAAVVWIELLIRAAMMYVGALLGTAVYAGLVDRQLWSHVKRWAGIMIAVDLIKPVIVIVLGLAGAVASNAGASDALSTVLSGLAILFLSIFASAAIYRFIPGFGDDMLALRRARSHAISAGQAVVNGPANFMKQGISTHGGRPDQNDGSGGGAGGGATTGGSGASAGVAAHSTRTGGSSGGSGSGSAGSSRSGPPPQASPPPAPRSSIAGSTTGKSSKGGDR
jgi:hypothetical protein